ncbi:hypothetical protein HDV02_003549 [Globomyces sp. JEL0801]|nr:hypothetical protein HDV02_003549 [Globomyces sp. JEL0801]
MCDIFPSKLWDNDYLKTCLYDDMDLFDALRAIRCKQNDLGPSLWSAISIPIKTDTLLDLRKKYKELCSYQVQHLGLHNIEDTTEEYSKFHSDLGENLLGTQDLQKLGQYAKRGISDHLRPKIWNLLLQSEVIGCYRSYKMDLIIDRMIQIDSKHAQNDDGYFIFEDLIKKIMMYWSRDNWITKALMKMNHELLAKDLYSEQGYNGIYPFWGISLYAMPVCYLHEDPGEAYILFRELYVRYFYKLHTPCNKNGGILQLCIQFENLVKETNSELYFHLSHTIEIQPLEIAFKWILYAFVGILDCEQVLLMWDRIIGYDCLGLLAVTAAALLTYRSDLLFMCKTPNQVMKCFDDCGMIKWVPLVQKFLKE